MKNILCKTSSVVEKHKNSLIAKAKKHGIYEDFGQKEVMVIKDLLDYNSLVYGSKEERVAASLIDCFDDWCTNYCLK